MAEELNTMEVLEKDAIPTQVPVLLLTADEAAALCHTVPRTWRTWHSTGKIPQPIRIGRKTFWRLEELKDWIAASCPDREMWNILRR